MIISPRLVAVIATCFCVSGYANPLTVSTWGGSHADAVSAEILRPFSVNFNVPVEQSSNDLTDGEALTLPGIVELSLSEAIDACEKSEILLLPVDRLDDADSNQNVIHDFVPNTLQPCAVGHSIWSTVVAFGNNRYGFEEKPHLISDFFDVQFYPGKRIIRRSPRVLAEWALVASGIAPSNVYAALDNPEQSWDLIDQKLKSIEEHIIWVDNDAEAIEFLHSGRAAFAMLSSDSLVRNSIQGPDQLGVLWDAAVTNLSLWAIPSDAVNPELSWEFIQYAASINNSGKVASVFGYGPVRYSTLQLMDRGYQKMLPSWPDNQHNLLWSNSRWWQDKSDFVTDRFTQWVLELEDRPELTLAAVSDSLAHNEIEAIDNVIRGGEEFLMHLPATVTVLGKLVN